ncbi:MAG: Mur ligase family protein, partial [Bacteroidota bacterium]
MKLTKADVLAVDHVKALGFDDARGFAATGVSTDSRSVKSGDLFVAIRGGKFDGHNFVTSAIEQGAAAVVVDRKWADANERMMISINTPRLIVEDTVHALGKLANGYRRKFDIPIIAVGGSNGKTTTKEMIRAVLAQKFRVLCTEGNLNNHLGVPQTLFRLEGKHDVAVIEVGTNHRGEIEYLCGILEPTHGLVTNIGKEHLEFFGTLDGVAKAEGELFRWLEAHGGKGFINGDDTRIVRQSRKLKKKIVYGLNAKHSAVKGTIREVDERGCPTVRIKAGTKSFNASLRIPGSHNVSNAVAATAVGLSLKV